MEWLTNPDIWMSFLTLCILEIILGIDNIIFISIISQKLPKEQQGKARTWGLGFALIIDIIFSLDSVITAVGMAEHVEVMIAAVIVSVIIMMLAINKISSFVDENPTIKILALSFLIMIGLALLADGLDFHIPKGYIYFSMAFALMVEAVNITISKRKRR